MIKIVFKKKFKMKLNCSLIIPVTKKPLETRMGSGKAERKF
jgi:ribosomal protein L16/L10AE